MVWMIRKRILKRREDILYTKGKKIKLFNSRRQIWKRKEEEERKILNKRIEKSVKMETDIYMKILEGSVKLI